ncbi:hypothetical protein E4U31_005667 [Claviceps sp. LM219 group G6]|nr:hypothetical protein E4U31_005667 [Claviceps sp. LM219 group G6]
MRPPDDPRPAADLRCQLAASALLFDGELGSGEPHPPLPSAYRANAGPGAPIGQSCRVPEPPLRASKQATAHNHLAIELSSRGASGAGAGSLNKAIRARKSPQAHSPNGVRIVSGD